MEENLCAFEGGQSGIDYATRLKQFLGRFNDRARDTVLERRGITLDPVGDTVMRRGKSIHLSPILFRLLAYFMNHPDQVITAKQLLADVWGRNSDPGRTVAMSIAYLRKAVADREANIIGTVRGRGTCSGLGQRHSWGQARLWALRDLSACGRDDAVKRLPSPRFARRKSATFLSS